MNDFLVAVGRAPLSTFLQESQWAIYTIQSIHIFTLAVVFTSAAVVDLRLLGVVGKGQALERMTARFFPTVGWGTLVLAATGVLLMMAEPTRAILNPYFQIKMAALLIVGLITWSLGRSVSRDPGRWSSQSQRGLSRIIAFVSLVLWVLIIIAGRWIAYGP